MASKPSLPLACPRCATRYSLDERFCADCGMPLTYAGKVDVTERATGAREQARKIKPEYTRGDLRRVATADRMVNRFWDYPRLGAPLSLAVLVAGSGLIAVFWPLAR